MQKRSLQSFFFFLFLSFIIFFLSKFKLLETPQSFLSKATISISSPILFLSDFLTQITQNDSEKKLKEENLSLARKLVDQQKLIEENKALHDQFQIANPRSLDLLPANVVGAPRFIPGIFSPENFIIDKGEIDDVKVGNAVVVKDSLIGKITKTSKFISQISLVTNPSLKFAAKTTTNVLGVIKGGGNGELFFDNVLLSDHLEKGELVLTSGDLKLDQTGFLPNIIVGQIVSIEANPTDLFQKAKLKTLVDFSKISKVFVVKSLR